MIVAVDALNHLVPHLCAASAGGNTYFLFGIAVLAAIGTFCLVLQCWHSTVITTKRSSAIAVPLRGEFYHAAVTTAGGVVIVYRALCLRACRHGLPIWWEVLGEVCDDRAWP